MTRFQSDLEDQRRQLKITTSTRLRNAPEKEKVPLSESTGKRRPHDCKYSGFKKKETGRTHWTKVYSGGGSVMAATVTGSLVFIDDFTADICSKMNSEVQRSLLSLLLTFR